GRAHNPLQLDQYVVVQLSAREHAKGSEQQAESRAVRGRREFRRAILVLARADDGGRDGEGYRAAGEVLRGQAPPPYEPRSARVRSPLRRRAGRHQGWVLQEPEDRRDRRLWRLLPLRRRYAWQLDGPGYRAVQDREH